MDVSFVFSFPTETCRRGLSIYKPRLFILVELGRTSFERIVQLFFSVFNRGLQSHRSLTPVVSFLRCPTSAPVKGSTAFLKVSKVHRLAHPRPPIRLLLASDPQTEATLWKTNKHPAGTQISCLVQGQRHARMPRLTALKGACSAKGAAALRLEMQVRLCDLCRTTLL